MTKSKNMIWKRLNFTGVKSKTKGNVLGTNQLNKSLEHSLRLVQKHGMEFNLDLKMNNFIVHKNKIMALDDLSKEERQAILNSIVDPAVSISESKQSNTVNNREISKYSYKIKQLISKNENEEFSLFLENILNNKSEAIDKGETLAQLDVFDVKRKDQKKNCLSTYIDLHNQKLEIAQPLPESFSQKRTVIQEAFWKFPFNQNVDEVTPEHYMKIISDFYNEHFPDYPVKLIVFHGDEITDPRESALGVHPHIFIDGKNSKTNKYDLIDEEFKVINKFRKSKNLEPLDRYDGKYKTTVELGVNYQEIIYGFVNQKLAGYGYDINVEVKPNTPEKLERNRLIKKDAALPKADRVYNSIQKGLENQKALEAENKKNKKLVDEHMVKLKENFIATKAEYKTELTSYYNKGKEKADDVLSVYLKDEKDKAKQELDEHLSMLDRVQGYFSSVINFVSTCIYRSLSHNQDLPTKKMLDDVNGDIEKIYKEFKNTNRDDFKIIDDFFNKNESELDKHNLKVGFVSSMVSRVRKAKIIP
jgi:hypothetical protein